MTLLKLSLIQPDAVIQNHVLGHQAFKFYHGLGFEESSPFFVNSEHFQDFFPFFLSFLLFFFACTSFSSDFPTSSM